MGSGLTKRGKWAYQAWAVGLPSVGSGLTKRGQWALVDADVAVTAAVYAGVSSAWHVAVAVIRLQLRRQALGTEAVHARDQSCNNRIHNTVSNNYLSAPFDTWCSFLCVKFCMQKKKRFMCVPAYWFFHSPHIVVRLR